MPDWRTDLDGPEPYGPSNPPQPPHHPRPTRSRFAKGCFVIIVACLAVGAVFVHADDADGGDIRQLPDCANSHEAHATVRGETRHQLRVRIGGQTPELYQADRIRDYPACNPWYALRIRYRADSWRVAAAFWLSCPRHHVAECTREQIL